MYLHVYLLCTQGPKMFDFETLPVLFHYTVWRFIAVVSLPSRTFTVVHFRDQLAIGLPRSFAH